MIDLIPQIEEWFAAGEQVAVATVIRVMYLPLAVAGLARRICSMMPCRCRALRKDT